MVDNRQGQTPRQTESDQESGAQIVLGYNNNYNKKANNVRYWAQKLCERTPSPKKTFRATIEILPSFG
jgi:hypothetical protein